MSIDEKLVRFQKLLDIFLKAREGGTRKEEHDALAALRKFREEQL